jgi:DNA-binding transcriptional ArsR family regulator
MPDTSSNLFNALGDPTRRQLYETLVRDGEQNVRTLTEASAVSQPMVSRHLATLQAAGLIVVRRQGREHYFSVRPAGLAPMADWIRAQTNFWQARLHSLDDLLNRMDN